MGRFISADPVGTDPDSGDNFNRYWYANNNPYRFTDPDGRLACTGSVPKTECVRPVSPWGDGRTPSFEAEGGEEHDPVADYKGRRNQMLKDAVENINGAAEHAAKEGAVMVLGGPITKAVGKAGIFLGVGRLAALSKAGGVMDRNGLTRAGRALQKHAGRPGSAFGEQVSHKDLNSRGQGVLNNILTSSDGVGRPNRFGGRDYVGADGRGARFDSSNQFMGFLEPPR